MGTNLPGMRPVPVLPHPGERLRLLIDSDAANEIDDLYAIALALRSPGRFAIEGFVATHFAQVAGRESIQQSYDLLLELLALAEFGGRFPVVKGGDPMRYRNEPSESDGTQLIIDRAQAGSEEDPLWVVGLGAATNLASALLVPIVILVRFISVGIPVSLLRFKREFSPHVIKILTWGGLRGGISIALALSLPPGPERELILALTYIIVIFSIAGQGLTIGKLIRACIR